LEALTSYFVNARGFEVGELIAQGLPHFLST